MNMKLKATIAIAGLGGLALGSAQTLRAGPTLPHQCYHEPNDPPKACTFACSPASETGTGAAQLS